MNALRWVILLAVVAVAGLLVYLATSDPAERFVIGHHAGDAVPVVGDGPRRRARGDDAAAKISPDGRTVEYSYTGEGLPKSIRTDEGTTTYEYDANGRLTLDSGRTTMVRLATTSPCITLTLPVQQQVICLPVHTRFTNTLLCSQHRSL